MLKKIFCTIQFKYTVYKNTYPMIVTACPRNMPMIVAACPRKMPIESSP